jgi:O-antigen ligase
MRSLYETALLHVRSRQLERIIFLYTAMVLMISLTGLDDFLHYTRKSPLIASALTFFLLVFIVSINFFIDFHSKHKQVCLKALIRSRPVLVPFAFIVAIALAYSIAPEAYWEDGNRYIKLYLFNFAVFVLGTMVVVTPGFVKNYRTVFLLCAMTLNLSVFADAMSPGLFYASTIISRPSGFIQNPNQSAMMVTILTICAVNWRKNSIGNLALWGISLLAVFATLSRSGLAMYFIMFLYYMHANSNWKVLRKRNNLIVLSVLVFFMMSWGGWGNILEQGDETLIREDTAFRAVDALLGIFTESDVVELGEDIRVELFFTHLDLISQKPIVGYGMKYYMATVKGSHNVFLSHWLEYGLIGLLALLFMLFTAFGHFKKNQDKRGVGFIILFSMSGFFSHNLLDSHALIIVMAMLTGLSTVEYSMLLTAQSKKR